jgi:hypothetical protein
MHHKIAQPFDRDLGLYKQQIRLELCCQAGYLLAVFSLCHHSQVFLGAEQPSQADSEDLFSIRD